MGQRSFPVNEDMKIKPLICWKYKRIQGSILRTLLFLIYADNLVKCIYYLFADDTTLIVDLDVHAETIIKNG